MLAREQKTNIIEKYKTHTSDTGSPEVQIALLSERIGQLAELLIVGVLRQPQGRRGESLRIIR